MKQLNGIDACGTIESKTYGTLTVFPAWDDQVNDDGNWEALAVDADDTIYMLTLYPTAEWDAMSSDEKRDSDHAWGAIFDLEMSRRKVSDFDDVFGEYEVTNA